MKWFFTMLVCLMLAGAAIAQTTPAQESNRLFVPKNFVWGYAQFDVAPPHNELDPNLCAANAGQYGGVNAPCSMFARYMLWGYVEVRPFARTPLKRLLFFGEPRFLFGKNIPQTLSRRRCRALAGSAVGVRALRSDAALRPASRSTSCFSASVRAIATWALRI
jgi:hypothetical protein